MKLFAFLTMIIMATRLYGQPEYFTPYAMESSLQIDADTLGILDESVVDPSGELSFYRKRLDLWLVRRTKTTGDTRGWRLNKTDQILKIERHDFNGGWPELMVTWQSMDGHSGWRGGVAEQYEEIIIYDLENSMILLHLDRMMFLETWSIQYLYDPDSADLDTLSPTYSTSDQYCEEYRISIRDSLIDAVPVYDNHCGAIEPEEELSAYSLVWRKNAFYRKD